MSNVLPILSVVIGLLRLANWFAMQVSQKEWEASGYNKRVAEETQALNRTIALANSSHEKAKSKTEAEQDEILSRED